MGSRHSKAELCSTGKMSLNGTVADVHLHTCLAAERNVLVQLYHQPQMIPTISHSFRCGTWLAEADFHRYDGASDWSLHVLYLLASWSSSNGKEGQTHILSTAEFKLHCGKEHTGLELSILSQNLD